MMMERKTFTATTPEGPDGPYDVSTATEQPCENGETEGQRLLQLMVDNDTSWEELEEELHRIESGRCMLCGRVSENLTCERCMP